MKEFIFYTEEGFTFSPYNKDPLPDCENFQILGSEQGTTAQSAFNKLMKSSPWIKEKGFSEIQSREVVGAIGHFVVGYGNVGLK